MITIGLTGNLGTGKSTVCGMLLKLGAGVINADTLGHELLESRGVTYDQLVDALGVSILKPGREIDREKLADITFTDEKFRALLNDITHPKLYKMAQDRIEQLKSRGAKVVVLEAALLIEAGWQTLVDQVWVTVAPEAVIVSRLKKQRKLNEEQVLARLHTQMPQESKAKQANVVIDTDCSLGELQDKVAKLWHDLHVSRQTGSA
jgi:dephospho-CoA kinase